MTLFEKREPTGNWFRDHSLGLTLTGLLLAQTIYCVWSGAYVWNREQPFGQVPVYSDQFWVWWSFEYNTSLVADTFGVWLIVYLSKFLYERGSSESQDS